LLFVPADQADKIPKALHAGADCVIFDLEDGVAPSHKTLALQIIHNILESHPAGPAILVRINPDPTQRDLDLQVAAHAVVQGIVIPKSNTAKDVIEVTTHLDRLENQKGIPNGRIKLFPLIETARGVMELTAIATSSTRVAGLVFGAEDWCLDMGIVRTKSGREIEYARCSISVAAHAFRLEAIDTVFADFTDAQGLQHDAEEARRLGFTGKLAIHPKQVDGIHAAFKPNASEIAEAEAVVRAFEKAEASGLGAISLDGRMIDRPIAARARKILQDAGK
jgi:citrate lyase subunit beta/citryl-CoA lyase